MKASSAIHLEARMSKCTGLDPTVMCSLSLPWPWPNHTKKTHAWQVVFSFLEPILNQTRQWCLVNGADHLTSFAGAQMETRRAGPERQAPLKPPVRGGKAARAKRFKRTNKKWDSVNEKKFDSIQVTRCDWHASLYYKSILTFTNCSLSPRAWIWWGRDKEDTKALTFPPLGTWQQWASLQVTEAM